MGSILQIKGYQWTTCTLFTILQFPTRSSINYDLDQRGHQLSGLLLGYACLTVQ